MQKQRRLVEEAEDLKELESRRRAPRHKIGVTANVQVMASPNPNIIGENFDTEVIEASAYGLRLSCDKFLNDCELGIWVNIEPDQVLFLTGEAR